MLDLSILPTNQRLLLAISGGRDSVVLLRLLLVGGFRDLHLVHLDHQLRGQDSAEDAHFVRELATQHDLPCTIESCDIAARSTQRGESIETAARNARHELFAKVAESSGISDILLAHHADDQAETLLFNLLRGSGGLRGMTPCTTVEIAGQALTLLRPLLNTRRSEIDTYLSQHQIAYREDSSNAELDYTRNRLRHEALPLLRDILNRDIIPTLARAADVTAEHNQILADLLIHLDLLDPQGRLFLPKLRDLPASLQKAALVQFLKSQQIEKLSHQLITEAVAMIPSDGPSKLNLPGNRFLRRKESRVFVEG